MISTATADNSGSFLFDVEPEEEYIIAVSGVEKYNDNQRNVSTKNLDAETTELDGNIALSKEVNLSLYCLVTDSKSALPLEEGT